MEAKGTIIFIGDTQYFGDKGFSKRELVLEIQDGQYTQKVPFEFIKERGDILDKFNIGEEVAIAFNLRGREYNGRYFATIEGWKINPVGGAKAEPEVPQTPVVDEEDSDNSLPF